MSKNLTTGQSVFTGALMLGMIFLFVRGCDPIPPPPQEQAYNAKRAKLTEAQRKGLDRALAGCLDSVTIDEKLCFAVDEAALNQLAR